jgi:hypothetical protein
MRIRDPVPGWKKFGSGIRDKHPRYATLLFNGFSRYPTIRVADPGCLSRIPDPDFYPSRIPDPKTATKERGGKKFVVITFYVATNFTKLQIILVLEG